MKYPVQYNTDGTPLDNHEGEDLAPGDAHSEDWDGEEAVPFPLAYSYPEDIPASDYAAGQEAADIEATLLSDLEAAATAFWTDLDSDDDETASNRAPEHDPKPDGDAEFEFDWKLDPSELIGPEPRRALIAFRPPRARKRTAATVNDAGPELRTVNFDVHATPDGAFADDLAARNKEFYDLLKRDSTARKLTMPPRTRRGPGFETIFPRAEPALRRQRPAPVRPAGSGLARLAAAAAILAVVVGAGIFVIAQQFSIPATSEDSIASLSGDDPAGATARLGAADEPESVAVSNHPKPADDRPTESISTVDPGTLTTPPLYESSAPAGGTLDSAEPVPLSPEFATIPLRTETVPAATYSTAPAAEAPPLAEDPSMEVAAPEPPPTAVAERPERKSAKIPASDKSASERESARTAVGAGKINTAVNMRAGPDNGEKVVRVLRAGTPVEILNSCKVWCEIVAGGERGFVFQRFITRTGGSARAEPTKLVPENIAAASLPERSEVAPREEARGPLNLLNFGRPNN